MFFSIDIRIGTEVTLLSDKKDASHSFFSQIKNRFSTKIECAVKKLSMDWLFVIYKNQIELNWKPNGFSLILTAAQRWTPFTNPTQAQPKSNQSGGWRNEEIVRWLKKRRNWDRERVKDQFLWRTPSKTYR